MDASPSAESQDPLLGSSRYSEESFEAGKNTYLEPQDMDPSWRSVIYAVGALEIRIGGSVFWILPGLWVQQTPSWNMDLRYFRRLFWLGCYYNVGLQ